MIQELNLDLSDTSSGASSANNFSNDNGDRLIFLQL